MMSCHQATRLLSEARDRKLRFVEKAELRMHLMMCSSCRNFGEHMDALSSFMKQYRDDQSGDSEQDDRPGNR